MPKHRKVTMSTTSTHPRGRRPRRYALACASAAAAVLVLGACSNTAGGGSPGATSAGSASGSFTVPEASAQARQAAIEKGFLNKDLKYDDLNPVLQATINKVATPLTAAQWSKLQECLK